MAKTFIFHISHSRRIFTLSRKSALARIGVTHIVSVLKYDFKSFEDWEQYEQLSIEVDDVEDENLLGEFEQTGIEEWEGREEGGGLGPLVSLSPFPKFQSSQHFAEATPRLLPIAALQVILNFGGSHVFQITNPISVQWASRDPWQWQLRIYFVNIHTTPSPPHSP